LNLQQIERLIWISPEILSDEKQIAEFIEKKEWIPKIMQSHWKYLEDKKKIDSEENYLVSLRAFSLIPM